MRRWLLASAFLGLLAGPSFSDEESGGFLGALGRELGFRRNPTAVLPTTITELRTKPETFRGLTVRFTVQFHERTRFWNPFFTRFTRDEYMNFSAWGDEQPIWVESEFTNDFPLLFVDRRGSVLETFGTAEAFERYECEGIVRDLFLGMPWVEVTKAESISDRLTSGALLHAARGHRLLEAGQWTVAANELNRALSEDLPDRARVSLLKELGACHLKAGEWERARSVLRRAAKLDPKDPEIDRALRGLLTDSTSSGIEKEPIEPSESESDVAEAPEGDDDEEGPEDP